MAGILASLLLGDGFIGSTLFFVIGGVVLAGLVVLLLVLRKQRPED